ncbi:hypothetical protein O6V14_04580 [Sphingomonas faeni]|uniref:hypothetical protein n=1 Tax=Sphingomonas faeni TaxID=185950 RepID=UPI0033562A3A
MLRLPRLTLGQKIVNEDGTPTVAFQQYVQQFAAAIEGTVNGIQQALDAAGIALDAAAVAQAAAENATAAASDASDAAAGSSAATAANAREQALVNSYIDPDSVLSASPTIITVAPHTRMYADGTSASVEGGTVPATAADDTDYVTYTDSTRVGGAVTYVVSTTAPVQTGDIHVVGAVMIPTTGTVDGGEGPRRPGYVTPRSPLVAEP